MAETNDRETININGWEYPRQMPIIEIDKIYLGGHSYRKLSDQERRLVQLYCKVYKLRHRIAIEKINDIHFMYNEWIKLFGLTGNSFGLLTRR